MKRKFTVEICAEYVIEFLNNCCDNKDEITKVLEKVLAYFTPQPNLRVEMAKPNKCMFCEADVPVGYNFCSYKCQQDYCEENQEGG